MEYEEKIISEEIVYNGGIIKVGSLEVLLPDGKTAKRDKVYHLAAAAVIPVFENGELCMVKQYRTAIREMSLEIPAGKLDEGEDPEVCAHRELREETGLTAGKMVHIVDMYGTPGYCDEKVSIYVAAGLQEGESSVDEGEFLSIEKLAVDRLVDMVLKKEIKDAKTIIGVLLADKILKGEINI